MVSPPSPIAQPSSLARMRIDRSRMVVRARLDQLGRALGQKAGARVRRAGRTVAAFAMLAGISAVVLTSLVVRALWRVGRR